MFPSFKVATTSFLSLSLHKSTTLRLHGGSNARNHGCLEHFNKYFAIYKFPPVLPCLNFSNYVFHIPQERQQIGKGNYSYDSSSPMNASLLNLSSCVSIFQGYKKKIWMWWPFLLSQKKFMQQMGHELMPPILKFDSLSFESSLFSLMWGGTRLYVWPCIICLKLKFRVGLDLKFEVSL